VDVTTFVFSDCADRKDLKVRNEKRFQMRGDRRESWLLIGDPRLPEWERMTGSSLQSDLPDRAAASRTGLSRNAPVSKETRRERSVSCCHVCSRSLHIADSLYIVDRTHEH